jgi:hypothetical protein
VLVLEDPDADSWRVNPHAPATEQLIGCIREAFVAAGGDFDMGRRLPELLAARGARPNVRAAVLALERATRTCAFHCRSRPRSAPTWSSCSRAASSTNCAPTPRGSSTSRAGGVRRSP